MGKTKLLILGATGMAGHVAHSYLKDTQQYEITNIVFRTPLNDESIIVDVTNREKLQQVIENENPDIILNCIGVLIGGSNGNPANAIFINAYLPHFLSSIAKIIDAKLIHISTDCVFSGKKGMYTENDFRDADDVYGRSKALGEVNNDVDLTIRTSIIGPEIKKNGEGLFHWFMNQTEKVNGFTEAFWGGITTLELAKVAHACIQQNILGVINITNGAKICKYDLLNLFKEIYKKEDVIINSIGGKSVDKSLVSIREDFEYEVPSYRKMIEEQFEYMDVNRDLYSSIYTY